MLEAWANDAVLFLFGLAIGGVLTIATLLDPRAGDRPENTPREPGENFLAWQRRILEKQDAMLQTAGRGFTATSFVFLGLITVLVLTVVLSPLELGWWYLVAGLVIGYVALRGVYELGKRGVITAPDRLLDWVAPGARRESQLES